LPKGTSSNFREEKPILLKRICVLSLSITLIATSFGLQSVWAQKGSDSNFAEKSRAKVEKLGTGRNARVEVRLRDKTRVKGYISGAEQESFTITDRLGVTRTIAYMDVSEVKKPSSGLSTRSWLIIGAVAAGAIVTWIVAKPAVCDGGAQSRFPC
jgi:hypothetical protein